jgi:hypothetical protein
MDSDGGFSPIMTAEQCRAARGWLGLTQKDLASMCKVGLSTLRTFEAGEPIHQASVTLLATGLKRMGVRFRFQHGAPAGVTVAVSVHA